MAICNASYCIKSPLTGTIQVIRDFVFPRHVLLRFRNTAKMAILKMKLCIFADELASLIPYHHK